MVDPGKFDGKPTIIDKVKVGQGCLFFVNLPQAKVLLNISVHVLLNMNQIVVQLNIFIQKNTWIL